MESQVASTIGRTEIWANSEVYKCQMKEFLSLLKNRRDLSRKSGRQDTSEVSPALKAAFVLRLSGHQEETTFKLKYRFGGSGGQESNVKAHVHSRRGCCPHSTGNSKGYMMKHK